MNSASLDFLASLELFGVKLGLTQTRELFRRIGDPQKSLTFLHVAGSNGKGSVCAMLEAALRSLGFHTGFYSSPHLTSPCERFRIDGAPVDENELCLAIERLRPVVGAMAQDGMKTTYFEATTALAADLFARSKTDYVIWEVGMGGRLDATNIVDPKVCAITGISMEHSFYLGDTLEKIAMEKAGIVKPGVPVCCSPATPPDALAAIVRRADELGAPVRIAPKPGKAILDERACQRFFIEDDEIALPLLGPHQRTNASTAREVLRVLFEDKPTMLKQALRGFRSASWPARFERMPAFGLIVDGAHNPEGAEALAATVREVHPGERFRFFFGSFSDKDTESGLRALVPLASEFVFLRPESSRSSKSFETLRQELFSIDPSLPCRESGLDEALSSLSPSIPTILCGSLHLCGDALRRILPLR